jgi:hypothetical protein
MSDNRYNEFWKATEEHEAKVAQRRQKLATDSVQIQDLVNEAKDIERRLMDEFKEDMRQMAVEFAKNMQQFQDIPEEELKEQ